MTPTFPMRIAKFLAHAGVASRRQAETMITAGRVALNGETLTTPATLVEAGAAVTVDGQPVHLPDFPRLWRYHKPAGVITTTHDPEGRPTVFEQLPPDLPRLVSVGRLDFNTEGLLLLTTSGELARHLEHPSSGYRRTYKVRVQGQPDPIKLQHIRRGVTIDGVRYQPAQVEQLSHTNSNSWVQVTLHEGKNREVRRLLDYADTPVNRLLRLSYGPFELGELARGGIKEVPRQQLQTLLPAFFGQE